MSVLELFLIPVVLFLLLGGRIWYTWLVNFLDHLGFINANETKSTISGLIAFKDKKGVENYLRAWLWLEEHVSEEEIEFMFSVASLTEYRCKKKMYNLKKDIPYEFKNGKVLPRLILTSDYIRENYGKEGAAVWETLCISPDRYQYLLLRYNWIDILPSKEIRNELVNVCKNKHYSKRFRFAAN